MSEEKDYYKILGVEKTASKEEIKKAYKKLAKQYHPDLNKDDPNSEKKFKEINEAASILTDEQKRSQYDQYGSNGPQFGGGQGGFGGAGFGSGFGGFDFNDIFDSFFGGGMGGSRSRGPRAGSDLRYDIEITLEKVAIGLEKKIKIKKRDKCSVCEGKGGKGHKTCSTCNGQGRVIQQRRTAFGVFQSQTVCNACRGRGETVEETCHHCNGTGQEVREKTIQISIPPGVEEGTRLRIANEGEAGEPGAAMGDLYIFVHIKENKIFHRDGSDLHIEVPITFSQAALGTTIEVPTITGKADLKVPAGTQPETRLRMKGKGLPHLRQYGNGDQYVKITVDVPIKLSKKQKELLKEFDKENKGKKPHEKLFDAIKEAFN